MILADLRVAKQSLSNIAWICFLLLYFGFYFYRIVHHSFWRDEAQAWLIAKESNSIGSLLKNTEFEGHPPIWYLLIKFIQLFSTNVEALKLVTIIFTTLTVFLLLLSKRFSRVQITSILLGFLFFSGYALVSRPYIMGAFLLLFAVIQSKNPRTNIPFALALSIASLTHVLFIPIIASLSICILFLRSRSSIYSAGLKQEKYTIFSIFLSTVSSLIYVWPSNEHEVQRKSIQFTSESTIDLISGFVQMFSPYHSEEINALKITHPILLALLASALFILILVSFWGQRLLLSFLIVTILVLDLNYVWGYGKGWWHTGIGFIGFLAFTFLKLYWEDANDKPKFKTQLINSSVKIATFTLFMLQVLGNYSFIGKSLITGKPYSNAREVAKFLEDSCATSCKIAAETDYSMAAISSYLDSHRILFLGSNRTGTYTIWRRGENHVATASQIEAATTLFRGWYLVTGKSTVVPSHNAVLVFETDGAVWADEDYKVYRIV